MSSDVTFIGKMMNPSTVEFGSLLRTWPSFLPGRSGPGDAREHFGFWQGDLVLRFICSVTYFLGRLCQRATQFAEQCVEILSCEPPLERFRRSLVAPLEGE